MLSPAFMSLYNLNQLVYLNLHNTRWLLGRRHWLCYFSSSSAGESAADRGGSLGEMVRPGLQHQGGGRGHWRGHLPVPGCLCGALRRPEAPPGPALLCILWFLCWSTWSRLAPCDGCWKMSLMFSWILQCSSNKVLKKKKGSQGYSSNVNFLNFTPVHDDPVHGVCCAVLCVLCLPGPE